MRTKLFLESTQNQCCFNVEFYRRINVDKSTFNQRGYHVDWRRDFISTYINIESMLSVYWVCDIYDYVSSEQKIYFRDFEHLGQKNRSCLLNYCKIIVCFTPCRSMETNPLTSSSKCAMSIILKLFS